MRGSSPAWMRSSFMYFIVISGSTDYSLCPFMTSTWNELPGGAAEGGCPALPSQSGFLPAIYCDFDGTITVEDAVDQLLAEHASPEWRAIEQLWDDGLIGSRECLERQIACVGHFTPSAMTAFVNGLHIDPSFGRFARHVQLRRIPFSIVSDGFDLIIRSVLEKHEIRGIPVFSNHLAFSQNRLIATFPSSHPDCRSQAGLCKCRVLSRTVADTRTLYIGDGRSDLCACRNADTVLAKGHLIECCRREGIPFVPFEDFDDVMDYVLAQEMAHASREPIAV